MLTTALFERFYSRGEADFADKPLSAMRYGFGGHNEKVAGKRAIGRMVPRAEIAEGLTHARLQHSFAKTQLYFLERDLRGNV